MQLGYVTNGLQNHRLEDALELLADHGYACVGLTPDVGHLDPYALTPAAVERVAGRLERLGLVPIIETGARYVLDPRTKHEPTLMTPDPDGVARRVDFYGRCGALARDLGATVVSFWAGTDHAPGPDSRRRLVDGVHQAVDAIRAAGVEPSFEPEPGMAVETLADFDRLTAALGDAAPALTLDVGHLYVTGEGDPVALCRARGATARQVHLEDIVRGVHEHLEPGAGDVDFDAVLDALAAAGYRGGVCFELSRSSHRAPAAVAACAALWQRWRGRQAASGNLS